LISSSTDPEPTLPISVDIADISREQALRICFVMPEVGVATTSTIIPVKHPAERADPKHVVTVQVHPPRISALDAV